MITVFWIAVLAVVAGGIVVGTAHLFDAVIGWTPRLALARMVGRGDLAMLIGEATAERAKRMKSNDAIGGAGMGPEGGYRDPAPPSLQERVNELEERLEAAELRADISQALVDKLVANKSPQPRLFTDPPIVEEVRKITAESKAAALATGRGNQGRLYGQMNKTRIRKGLPPITFESFEGWTESQRVRILTEESESVDYTETVLERAANKVGLVAVELISALKIK